MASKSDSTVRQDPSSWRSVLPAFVDEVREVIGVSIAHNLYNNTISVTTEFIAQTDQAKRDFPLKSREYPLTNYVICHACGKRAKDTDITQFGQCDHLICKDCVAKDNRTTRLYDGSSYCPHSKCVEEIEKHLKEMKEGQSMTIKKALQKAAEKGQNDPPSSSDDCCFLVIVTYRLILEDWKGEKITIMKKQDLMSDTRMEHLIQIVRELLAQIKGYDDDEKLKGKWFYSAVDDKSQLTRFLPKEVAKKKLEKLVGQVDHMYLTLDLTNGSKKAK